MKLRVEGNPNLVRDTSTGVILNRDDHARVEYESKKAKARAEKARQANLDARVGKLEADIDKVTSDIADIKYLLQLLVDKQNG